MISEDDILSIWKSTIVAIEEPKHICKFCNRAFVKESTLNSHACEKKRRHQQEKETGVQWGFQAYLLFYSSTQSMAKPKTYQDFSESSYYLAFVKFGRYCVGLRCVNFTLYTQWLLKNNKKIDQWCSDKLYEAWLIEYIRKESVQDALERALKEMQEYADTHPELKNGFNDYFRYANSNRIVYHISTGRISPWVVYNCASGITFLGQLNEVQVGMIMPWIDPDVWQARFKENQSDIKWAKEILTAAGL
jgi:hypothetical protein